LLSTDGTCQELLQNNCPLFGLVQQFEFEFFSILQLLNSRFKTNN